VKEEKTPVRIGYGYDVHRMVEGRKLIVGGVTIDFLKGLEGHSDADVLLHAVSDALLGALALGDIGVHFPDRDPRYKDISSLVLLKEVWDMVRGKGYLVGNVDATIIAQEPKLSPHISQMRKNIAEVLEVSATQISVKATTSEGLGFVGRGEAIAVHAVALVKEA
jgi:2-C-methyl-D-erythritol 2,4-cyclodiphosphate synthase